jgi:prepilin-type N-terminal cleavage/methylation domain-containing protein
MLHLPIHPSHRQNFDRGFTLVEILTILIISGILLALATPNLVAFQGVAKLNSALDNLRTVLETSQFQAIQRKVPCQVSIPQQPPVRATTSTTENSRVIATCVADGRLAGDSSGMTTIDNDIIVYGLPTTSDPDFQEVVYNKQGLTQNSGTIVLYSTVTSEQRCLIVNAGVGLIRTGKYGNS